MSPFSVLIVTLVAIGCSFVVGGGRYWVATVTDSMTIGFVGISASAARLLDDSRIASIMRLTEERDSARRDSLRLRAERDEALAHRVGAVVGVLDEEVERLELLTHELVDPVQLLLVLLIGLEVVRHGCASRGAAPVRACARTPIVAHPAARGQSPGPGADGQTPGLSV